MESRREEYHDDVNESDREALENADFTVRRWRCGKARIVKGCRIFLVRLGLEPKGLVGIGEALGKPKNTDDPSVKIAFTRLRPEPFIPWDVLSKQQPFARVAWSNQNPAIVIPGDVVQAIDDWLNATPNRVRAAGARAPGVAQEPERLRANAGQHATTSAVGAFQPLLIHPPVRGQKSARPYIDELSSRLRDEAVEDVFAVSYVARRKALRKAGVLHPRRKTRLLLRPPDGIPRKDAEKLEEQLRDSAIPGLEVRQLKGGASKALAHLKVIRVVRGDERYALVGSSNFTNSGLGKNIEVNALVTPDLTGFDELEQTLERLWDLSEPLDPSMFANESWKRHDNQPLHLLDFQADKLRELSKCHARGERGAILSLPTGTGKTVVAARFLLDKVLTGPTSKVLWVAPQVELLVQAASTFAEQRLFSVFSQVRMEPPERVRSAKDRRELESDYNIIFRVLHTAAKGADGQRFDAVVIDEAHWGASNSALLLPGLTKNVQARFWLGLTATPFRTHSWDDSFLTDRFPVRIEPPPDIDDVTDALGLAVRAEVVGESVKTRFKIRLSDDELSARELSGRALNKFNASKRNKKIANTWSSKHHGQTLVFAIDTAHANELCREFKRSHPKAKLQVQHSGDMTDKHLSIVVPPRDGRFGDDERHEVYKRFRRGQIDVLIGVNMYTTGVDFPTVQTLFMARPTLSPLLYAQMLGRGRRGPAFGGTEKVYVVDFADQLETHAALRERILNVERERGYDAKRQAERKRWREIRDQRQERPVPEACEQLRGRQAVFRVRTLKRQIVKKKLSAVADAGRALERYLAKASGNRNHVVEYSIPDENISLVELKLWIRQFARQG